MLYADAAACISHQTTISIKNVNGEPRSLNLFAVMADRMQYIPQSRNSLASGEIYKGNRMKKTALIMFLSAAMPICFAQATGSGGGAGQTGSGSGSTAGQTGSSGSSAGSSGSSTETGSGSESKSKKKKKKDSSDTGSGSGSTGSGSTGSGSGSTGSGAGTPPTTPPGL
jgi:hypothetical protein